MPSAAQRVTQVTSSWNDATHPGTLAHGITYTPWGALSSLTNGCAGSGCVERQENYAYNSRLQVMGVQLGTSSNHTANYDLTYNYNLPGGTTPPGCPVQAAGSGNNGNVIGYTYTDTTNPSLSHSALYVYDGLNRLACAQATGSSTYNLAFDYDRWGNMKCTTSQYTNGPCPNWSFDTGKNRITTSGFGYDAAGNLTNDGAHSYQWDAEGRLVSVDGVAGQTCQGAWTSCLTYNALGWVVRRSGAAGGGYVLDTVYDPAGRELGALNGSTGGWYGQDISPGGRILAFYAGTTGTYFRHVNALGSIAMLSYHTGVATEDLLFYPWGQMWASQGTVQDLRYAGFQEIFPDLSLYPTPARLYPPNQGRWLSPDPLAGDISNPQSLNRYAYVLNNPTTLIDPLGLQHCPPGTQSIGPGQCRSIATGGEMMWRPMWDEFDLINIAVRAGTVIVSGESGLYEVGGPIVGNGLAILPLLPDRLCSSNEDLLARAQNRVAGYLTKPDCAKDFEDVGRAQRALATAGFKDLGPIDYQGGTGGQLGWEGPSGVGQALSGARSVALNSQVNWAWPGNLLNGEKALVGVPVTPNQLMDITLLHELAHYQGKGDLRNADTAKAEATLWKDCID